MAPQTPSIQSFFQVSKTTAHATPATLKDGKIGDGFAHEEVDAVVHPTIDDSWLPSQDYEEYEIGMHRSLFFYLDVQLIDL
jgi:hypothetical protein